MSTRGSTQMKKTELKKIIPSRFFELRDQLAEQNISLGMSTSEILTHCQGKPITLQKCLEFAELNEKLIKTFFEVLND